MAAGVIRNLTDFRLAFQHPFYTLTDQQEDMDFQEGSSEEEEEEEEEEMEEEEEEEEEEEGAGGAAAPQYSSHGTTEMTIQLLRFADLINCDIQRYFGKKSKEEDPDACEIYEDRLSTAGRSGRERYYADLMRVAQSRGREEEEELPHALRAICSRDSIQQLGPLAELFSFGLRRYVKPGATEHARRQKGERRHGQGVPMCKRRLPPSFWAEPAPHPPTCLLSATNTPDFSDLLANWTCESSQELQGVSSTDSPRQQTLETAHYHIA
ncbi:protein PERCC1-like [Polyodon spathula]|uniref:protein PERCC1-like n=1 Tax=Polyodon spathula TaxID=7913 RepID=UPI001B7E8D02|nr:protein PERCC1-like [Polyodon spathula]